MNSTDPWSEPCLHGYVDRINCTEGVFGDIVAEEDKLSKRFTILPKNLFGGAYGVVAQRPGLHAYMNTTNKTESPLPTIKSFVQNISYQNLDKLTHLNWSVCSNNPEEYQFLELMLPGVDTTNITISSNRNIVTVSIIPILFGSNFITKSKLNLHIPLDITINLVNNIVVDRVESLNGEFRIRLIPEKFPVVVHNIL